MKRTNLTVMLAAFIAATLSFCSCRGSVSEWDEPQRWYQPANGFDINKTDVLYLVSTDVLSAVDENGNECWQAQLTETDLDALRGEIAWVEANMFDGFNVIAPYYHQLTFDALTKANGDELKEARRKVVEEVCSAFDYYIEKKNGGRPFIIAGFSQGSMMAVELLKHISDEQYSRMIACYSLGYRLSAEDLMGPHIRAAVCEGDTGVVISFNSTQTREAIWPLVSADAATCINPMNWKTDSTPSTFQFNGISNTVHIDPETNVLLVETDDPAYFYSYYELAPFFLDAGVDKNNLHHWDLLFYPRQIHDNALLRTDYFLHSPLR